MISFVNGPLISIEIEQEMIVVAAGPVGLEIRVPVSVLQQLPPLGEQVMIYTHFQVREDAMSLYGFLHPQDREMFRQLLGVNGVGPKAALGILSVLTPDDLRMALLAEDIKAISRAPGIGSKTAKRLILDLKDKVDINQLTGGGGMPDSVHAGEKAGAGAPSGLQGAAREAVLALVALEYSNLEAAKAVKQVELKEGMSTEDILREALRYLAFL